MNTADLDLKVHRNNSIPVLALSGDVDEFTCAKLREAMRCLLNDGESRIIVNLVGVNYMDSAGLGTLVGGLRRINEADGGLALSGPNHHVERILSLTGLDKILHVWGGDTEAAASLTRD